jgi:DNA-binding beta-propeller fold protein YncE
MGSPVAAGTNPLQVAIHPQGQFAYVASELSNTVSAYRIGSDGALTSIGSLVATGHYPRSLAVDATGFVYVTNQGDNSVSAYPYRFRWNPDVHRFAGRNGDLSFFGGSRPDRQLCLRGKRGR